MFDVCLVTRVLCLWPQEAARLVQAGAVQRALLHRGRRHRVARPARPARTLIARTLIAHARLLTVTATVRVRVARGRALLEGDSRLPSRGRSLRIPRRYSKRTRTRTRTLHMYRTAACCR